MPKLWQTRKLSNLALMHNHKLNIRLTTTNSTYTWEYVWQKHSKGVLKNGMWSYIEYVVLLLVALPYFYCGIVKYNK